MSAFFFKESELRSIRVLGDLIELDLGFVGGGVFKGADLDSDESERMFDMTVRLVGVRSITEDGTPCEGWPKRAGDGELLSFEIEYGCLEMVIQWHQYQPTNDPCNVYVFECERVELIPSLHPQTREEASKRL